MWGSAKSILDLLLLNIRWGNRLKIRPHIVKDMGFDERIAIKRALRLFTTLLNDTDAFTWSRGEFTRYKGEPPAHVGSYIVKIREIADELNARKLLVGSGLFAPAPALHGVFDRGASCI